ncbi:MMEL1 [Mytilus coruscus]|uniref:MMEL1 n=1 Tax=Mytilus coruscus TaxID=42192 RepID=A0A6J8EGM3_MYTCO|nr:MMEL1 [Mytilus coruscus]
MLTIQFFRLDLIEKHGAAVLKDLMAELGGWPMIGSFYGVEWNPKNFNLTKLLLGLLKYNNRILMDMYAYTDSKNSSTRILFIDQADFGMPGRKYYLKERNDTMIMAYETLGKSIAIELGADPDVAAKDMEKVVDLEIDLANITVPDEDRRDNEALYNKMPLYDLPKNFTTANLPFNWIDYVQGALGSEMVQIDVPIDEPIVVRAPLYFERLFNTLSKYDNRTIVNFMIWRIMQNRANNLPQRFKDLIQNYNQAKLNSLRKISVLIRTVLLVCYKGKLPAVYKTSNVHSKSSTLEDDNVILYGTSTPRARWRGCTSYVNTNFGLATGRLFVKESFHESAKNDTLQLIGNLLESFHELLDHADWMDDATRVVAREKADFIQKKIGYQDDIMDDEILNEIYQNITIDADTYLANVLNVISSISADSFLFLREPVNKNVSLNYGGIGVVIGHEITHGFDDRGRQYDKDGNLVQWWSDEVIKRFDTQTQCLVNGINTLGENIADNGGLKQSFRAYKRWVEENGEEKQLPGLKYNHDQLFFIGFAQVWCGSMRRESAINRILTGVHSPGRFRVIGTLQNSKDFSKAFSCKQGSYMNPDKKCYVW